MLLPIFGFLQGDTLGLVLVIRSTDRVSDLAAMLQQAASVRVAPREKTRVYWGDKVLSMELTIDQTGLTALERVDVVAELP